MSVSQAEKDEIYRLGESIYRQQLQQFVDTEENRGKVLVLDIDSNDFEIDADQVTASRRLRQRRPESRRYALRIGYPSLYKVAGGWAKIEQTW